MRFKISDIAEIVNIPIQNPATSGINVFVGLEHYDVGEPVITRFGSTEMLTTTVKRFNAGDILLARRNVYLRRAGKVDFSGVTSGDTIVIRVKDNLNDGVECDSSTLKSLLPFVLNTNAFWDYANTNSDGTMSKRLSPQLLLDYEFDLPSKDEQKALADKLWAAYHLKESYKKMISATEEMVKSQFIEMFGQINIDSPCLNDVAKIYDGTHKTPTYTEAGIPFVSVENINDIYASKKYISEDDYAQYKYKPEYGDVFMTRIGSIGKCAVYESSAPLAYYVSLALIKPNKEMILPKFLKYYLESNDGSLELKKHSLLKAFPMKINLGEIGKIKIILPAINRQKEFVQIAEQADKSEYVVYSPIAKPIARC